MIFYLGKIYSSDGNTTMIARKEPKTCLEQSKFSEGGFCEQEGGKAAFSLSEDPAYNNPGERENWTKTICAHFVDATQGQLKL